MPLIMVVDDDQDLAEMLGIVLTSEGYEVNLVSRGDEVIPAFESQAPDLVLLDIMLPGIDGIEVCKQIRQESMVPIVMLTAKSEESDKILGLDSGADDYVTKPFSPRELVLRVKKLLTRSTGRAEEAEVLHFGELTIDRPKHLVNWQGKTIELTATEFIT